MDERDEQVWAQHRWTFERRIARSQNRATLIAAVLTRRITLRTARRVWRMLDAHPDWRMTVTIR